MATNGVATGKNRSAGVGVSAMENKYPFDNLSTTGAFVKVAVVTDGVKVVKTVENVVYHLEKVVEPVKT